MDNNTVRAIDGTSSNIAFSRNVIWRSALKAGIDAMNMASAPANSWLDAIKGLIKKGATKAAEVEWSGISDWLELQSGKVTKAQIGEYLGANGVQVQEVVLGGKSGQEQRDALQAETDEKAKSFFDKVEPSIVIDGKKYYTDELYYELADGELSINSLPSDLQPLARDWFSSYNQLKTFEPTQVAVSKYSKYQLPGGSNYREVLLTLPTGGPSNISAMSDAELRALIQRNDDDAEVDGVSRADLMVMIDGMELGKDDISRLTGKNTAQYKSSHWDQPNVLAHIRLSDRTDADCKKVLFVEELQSDWAQDGRKRGFGQKEISGFKFDDKKKDWVKVPESEATHFGMTDESDDTLWNSKEEAERKLKPGVPAAPFIAKTDGWLNLALKRVAKMAVDGGYHKVAFVTGEQSVARYDLSKQVSRVVWNEKLGTLAAQRADSIGASDDRPSIKHEGVTANKLPDIIGKDAADRLVNAKEVGGWKPIEGDDLKVGGEGMKAFYDKIVPQAAGKLIAKLGGGKMETVRVDNGADAGTKKWTVQFTDGSIHNSSWVDRRIAEQIAKPEYGDKVIPHGMTGSEQSGFSITDAMREYASNGMPMFSKEKVITNPTTVEALQTAIKQQTGEFLGSQLGRIVATTSSEIKSTWEPLIAGLNKATIQFAKVWHGSAHNFQRFDSSKIGTGEGAQVYGHGLYFAESPDVARSYKEKLQGGILGEKTREILTAALEARGLHDLIPTASKAQVLDTLAPLAGKGSKAMSVALKRLASSFERQGFNWQLDAAPKVRELANNSEVLEVVNSGSEGTLYQVSLPDEAVEKMLDWDKPLREQRPEIVSALRNGYKRSHGVSEHFLDEVFQPFRTVGSAIGAGNLSRQMTDSLCSLGIPGIRYRDGNSRFDGASTGTSNYVVFPGNEHLLTIVERNGKPVNDVQYSRLNELDEVKGMYDPASKTIFLIADHIEAGTEHSVIAHELMHKHGKAVLSNSGWARLHSVIGGWKDAPEGSRERAVYEYAANAVRLTGPGLSSQELFPYAVEGALRMGIKPDLQAVRDSAPHWLASVKRTMTRAWQKLTNKPASLSAQDLVDLAFGIAQRENHDVGTLLDAKIETWARELPRANGMVDGRLLRTHIPNRSSIDASIANNEVLPGVRAVELSSFDYVPEKPDKRTLELAAQIAESGELNPLIVGIDADGPYIIEGAHRLDALFHLKAKALPALVVLDLDALELAPEEQEHSVANSSQTITPNTKERSMLEPLQAIFSRGANQGWSDEVIHAKQEKLLDVLLNPRRSEPGETVIEVFAHGAEATRAVIKQESEDLHAHCASQIWSATTDGWLTQKTFPDTPEGRSQAYGDAKEWYRIPSASEAILKWGNLHSTKDGALEALIDSRAKLAEFWYETKVVDWGNSDNPPKLTAGAELIDRYMLPGGQGNPFTLVSAVADTEFNEAGVANPAYSAKFRDKIDTLRSNFASAWGEQQPFVLSGVMFKTGTQTFQSSNQFVSVQDAVERIKASGCDAVLRVGPWGDYKGSEAFFLSSQDAANSPVSELEFKLTNFVNRGNGMAEISPPADGKHAEDAYCISITYETSTPEDRDMGEASERGFVVDREVVDAEQLAIYANYHSLSEPSCSDPRGAQNIWFSSSNPPQDREFFEKDLEKTFSLHVHSINGAEPEPADYQAIANLIGAKFRNPMELTTASDNESLFGYSINLDERGDFYADVRDAHGATVYEIHDGASLSEGDASIFEDGFMRHKNDLDGLTNYLRDLGVIPKTADVLPLDEFEKRLNACREKASNLSLT